MNKPISTLVLLLLILFSVLKSSSFADDYEEHDIEPMSPRTDLTNRPLKCNTTTWGGGYNSEGGQILQFLGITCTVVIDSAQIDGGTINRGNCGVFKTRGIYRFGQVFYETILTPGCSPIEWTIIVNGSPWTFKNNYP